MAGNKRERELARARAARQAERAEAERRRKQRVVAAAALVAAVVVIGGVAWAVSGDDSSPSSAQPAPTETATSRPGATATTKSGDPRCAKPSSVKAKEQTFPERAYDEIVFIPDGKYTERMTTNCGVIEFTLDKENAPETSKALLYLSDRKHYYDGVTCHRLTTEGIYVLQCGDPSGTGAGEPGFTVPDENLPEPGADGTAVYARGTVAMANRGPNTASSQFFIVYEDSPLPPSYTVVGEVKRGMDVVDHVAAAGTKGDGQTPKQTIKIEKMISAVSYPAVPR